MCPVAKREIKTSVLQRITSNRQRLDDAQMRDERERELIRELLNQEQAETKKEQGK